MNLISVIIPIYNCQKYLKRCLDSVTQQSHTNLQILLVNDGSTDSSKDICQEYAQKDPRITIIDKQNGGVSSARNLGLKNATGDYVAFVDSDDFIELNMYETLYNEALKQNADMTFCRIKRVSENGNISYPEEVNLNKLLTKDIAPLFYTTNYANTITKIEGVVWRTLFKREFIENNFFDEKVNYGEDLLYIASLILQSNKIAIVNDYLYNYFTNTSSACNLINQKYFDNLDGFYTASINFLQENNLTHLKFLVDYGYLVRLIQNKLSTKNFVKEIKLLSKTNQNFKNCLSKESYKQINQFETKKSVKIRNYLIYHKHFCILKMLYKIKK